MTKHEWRTHVRARAHNRNRVWGKRSEVRHVDALKRWSVTSWIGFRGQFSSQRPTAQRDRKDRKTSKPRSPNSLPLELLIESKAGGGVSKLITPGPISSYIYRSCLVTPLDQKSGFMRNSLVLFDQLAQNGYDLRRPGNWNVAILL